MIFYFVGMVLTVIGFVYLVFPSKQRSNKYGYRTQRAKTSDKTYAYAQKEAAKAFLMIGLITFAIGFLLTRTGMIQFFIIELFVIILPITRVFYIIERNLERFIDNEEGVSAK
ncbi:MAG: SdpI family protein [Vagococcus fluvialis]